MIVGRQHHAGPAMMRPPRVDVGDAAIDRHRSERRDQERHLAVDNEKPVQSAERAADGERHQHERGTDAVVAGGAIGGEISFRDSPVIAWTRS